MDQDQLQLVKDSKYSWLVMASMLYSMFLCGMLSFGSVSVLVYVWSEMFEVNADLVAWAPAIMGASYQMTGPFLAMLMQVIGLWRFHLIGASLILCASIATAFASQYWHVIVSFAIVQGLGAAMIELSSTEVIASYVKKHKEKMYAAPTLTFSIGIMVTPPLLEYLIKVTSYKAALIILAMPNVLSFPIAFVYRGLWCAHVESNAKIATDEGCHNSAYNGENNERRHSENSQSTEQKQIENTGQTTPVHTGQIGATDSEQTTSMAKDSDAESKQLSVLASHKHVLKDPIFILFLFFSLFVAAGEFTFYAFAVDFSVSMNILTLAEAALGMTLTSVSFFAAGVLLTVLSHWNIDRLLINVLSVLIMGLAFLGVSLSQSMAALYTCFILFGFAEGLYDSNQVCFIASHFTHSKYMIIRYSYVCVVTGVGGLLGPIVAGNFAENLGMKYQFILIGTFPLTGFGILLPYLIAKKISAMRSRAIN